jgi:hypothetical protein
MVAAVVVVGLVLIWSLVSWEPIGRREETDVAEAPAPAPAAADKGEPVAPDAPQAAPTPAPAVPAPAAEAPRTPADKDPNNDVSAWPVPEMSGPVAEFKSQFEAEPTDSNAIAAESAIQTGFAGPAVHPALLDSVLCHTLVCRIRMRWTHERGIGFMAGLMHVVTDPLDNLQFESNLAIDQPMEPNAAGERSVDVYVRLQHPVAR